ncbi:site-specific integrase [Burkholderia vietnamiensis]|uniref:site-specific integrase n=1 Tax=Burkholderia vietnamiensis TaxID=60552 RepID=UPI001D15087B|nr:site-specific integrase [Burkholderia vietnamiensis]UEC01699.1 site-specific integrase [Burkholderia vietnamiensis]
MLERDNDDDSSPEPKRDWTLSVEMLRAVLQDQTYEAVAALHGITRTAVERRIKSVARRLAAIADIEGLNEDGAAFVRRLRMHRLAVLAALSTFDPTDVPAAPAQTDIQVLREEEITTGAQRIRTRSHQPFEDLALYYMLFATAARPLEIARLEVRDYLDADGTVRRTSEIREEVAITGRSRPLYFRSARLDEAMTDYLAERALRGHGLGDHGRFGGFDPTGRLFLSPTGRGFEITRYGDEGQRRFLCRAIQETYRKLFRYAGFKGVTALTVRHTVADRLYARGADESQVGLLLGIAERSAVREQFPRRLPTMDELTRDLV